MQLWRVQRQLLSLLREWLCQASARMDGQDADTTIAGPPMEEYERRPWVPPVETSEEQRERYARAWKAFWIYVGLYALPIVLACMYVRGCR
jgi:hypothetical protein